MSKRAEKKCNHGWTGESYKHIPGDSVVVTHHKNNVNSALESSWGVPDAPTAGGFALQSFFNARTFKASPKVIESECACSKDSGPSMSGK